MSTQKHIHISPRPGSESPADMLVIASHLAGREEIGAVHVISGCRPTYDEFVRFRSWADAHGLDLTVCDTGVSFHPRRLQTSTPPEKETFHDSSAALVHRFMPVLDWMRIHGQTWRAEFSAMSEGTR